MSIPYGYCKCGCGQKTRVADGTDSSCGDVKGEPRRYILGHYAKHKRFLNEGETITVGSVSFAPLPSRKHFHLYAIVDTVDVDRVKSLRWNPAYNKKRDSFYAQAPLYEGCGSRSMVLLHRFILGLSKNDPDVDHINGNGLDCRRENLRLCTSSQNARNRKKSSDSSVSQFKGVSKERHGRWFAYIKSDGVQSRIGNYDTELEAAFAYDDAARSTHGTFAVLNFPYPGERSAITGEVQV